MNNLWYYLQSFEQVHVKFYRKTYKLHSTKFLFFFNTLGVN
jgi:hypothetical protein